MQKKITSFDNVKINYDICRISRKFLILVHGSGGDLSAWNKEREIFHKKGVSTVAIDLRGHGLSDRPDLVKDYMLENFAKDIHHILKKERISNFVLVGHCFGGVTTIMFHNLYPHLAKAYVLVDATYKAPITLKKSSQFFSPLVKILNNIMEHKKTHKKHSHADFSKFFGTGDWNIRRIYSDIRHTSFKSWFFTYENLTTFDGIKTLKSINKPVLIIEGEKDSIFKVHVAKKIKKLVKKSQLKIIPGANHIIVINNPNILANEIFHFLSSLPDFVKNHPS